MLGPVYAELNEGTDRKNITLENTVFYNGDFGFWSRLNGHTVPYVVERLYVRQG